VNMLAMAGWWRNVVVVVVWTLGSGPHGGR